MLEKLKKVHEAYGSIIIAVDFDDTLYNYSGDHDPSRVIELVRQAQALDHTILLFTCREGDRLKEAMKHLDELEIFPDFVNEQPLATFQSRKPFFNILLDDKASLEATCDVLEQFLREVYGS